METDQSSGIKTCAYVDLKMVRKCCVPGCKPNCLSIISTIRSRRTTITYKSHFKGQYAKWPKYCRLCQTFPPGFPVLKTKRKSRPREPQSVFKNIPKSLIPTPPSPKQPIKKAESSSRSEALHNELSIFLKNGVISSFETLCVELPHRQFEFELASFKFDSKLLVQSKQFGENSGIPKFSLKEKQDFTYNACYMGVKCKVSVLTKNSITLCNRWSTIEEALRFLDSFEADKKKDVLMQQTDAMSSSNSIHEQRYTPKMIVQRFEYFAKPRSC